jgi:S-(hydroxymethyl)glutathione dehydrogenase/alcohol dehydrogenase
MRAAVCRAFGAPLRIEDLELRSPGPGEVSVRIGACAICHSDVSLLEGVWGGDLPAVYGHEAAGVVEDVGAGVRTVAPGDHVVVTLIRSCGRCRTCLLGEPSLCEELASFPLSRETPLRTRDGEAVAQGLRTAAFAERVTVDVSQVVTVPDDVSLEAASLLACGVVTGVGAVLNTARMRRGASAAVIGVGGVGLNVVQGAAIAGAETLLAVDLLDSKLEAARAFGATHTAHAEDAEAVVGELMRGRGLEYVYVAASSAKAVELGLRLVGRAGTVVLIGLPGGARVDVDPELVADWSLRILGSKMGATVPQRDIPLLVGLYRQGRLKLDELVSGRYPLERIDDAIAAAQGGLALRPVVVP